MNLFVECRNSSRVAAISSHDATIPDYDVTISSHDATISTATSSRDAVISSCDATIASWETRIPGHDATICAEDSTSVNCEHTESSYSNKVCKITEGLVVMLIRDPKMKQIISIQEAVARGIVDIKNELVADPSGSEFISFNDAIRRGFLVIKSLESFHNVRDKSVENLQMVSEKVNRRKALNLQIVDEEFSYKLRSEFDQTDQISKNIHRRIDKRYEVPDWSSHGYNCFLNLFIQRFSTSSLHWPGEKMLISEAVETGIFDPASLKVGNRRSTNKLSLYDAAIFGLIDTDTFERILHFIKPYSLENFIECTQFDLDANQFVNQRAGTRMTLSSAVNSGKFDPEILFFTDLSSGEIVSLGMCIHNGSFDISVGEFCSITSETGLTVSKAIEESIISPEVDAELISSRIRAVRFLKAFMDIELVGVINPHDGDEISIREAVLKGLLDIARVSYFDPFKHKRLTIVEAAIHSFIRPSIAESIFDAMSMMSLYNTLCLSKFNLNLNVQGSLRIESTSFVTVLKERTLDPSCLFYYDCLEDKLTSLEAATFDGLFDIKTGCFVVSGEQLSIECAIHRELINPKFRACDIFDWTKTKNLKKEAFLSSLLCTTSSNKSTNDEVEKSGDLKSEELDEVFESLEDSKESKKMKKSVNSQDENISNELREKLEKLLNEQIEVMCQKRPTSFVSNEDRFKVHDTLENMNIFRKQTEVDIDHELPEECVVLSELEEKPIELPSASDENNNGRKSGEVEQCLDRQTGDGNLEETRLEKPEDSPDNRIGHWNLETLEQNLFNKSEMLEDSNRCIDYLEFVETQNNILAEQKNLKESVDCLDHCFLRKNVLNDQEEQREFVENIQLEHSVSAKKERISLVEDNDLKDSMEIQNQLGHSKPGENYINRPETREIFYTKQDQKESMEGPSHLDHAVVDTNFVNQENLEKCVAMHGNHFDHRELKDMLLFKEQESLKMLKDKFTALQEFKQSFYIERQKNLLDLAELENKFMAEQDKLRFVDEMVDLEENKSIEECTDDLEDSNENNALTFHEQGNVVNVIEEELVKSLNDISTPSNDHEDVDSKMKEEKLEEYRRIRLDWDDQKSKLTLNMLRIEDQIQQRCNDEIVDLDLLDQLVSDLILQEEVVMEVKKIGLNLIYIMEKLEMKSEPECFLNEIDTIRDRHLTAQQLVRGMKRSTVDVCSQLTKELEEQEKWLLESAQQLCETVCMASFDTEKLSVQLGCIVSLETEVRNRKEHVGTIAEQFCRIKTGLLFADEIEKRLQTLEVEIVENRIKLEGLANRLTAIHGDVDVLDKWITDTTALLKGMTSEAAEGDSAARLGETLQSLHKCMNFKKLELDRLKDSIDDLLKSFESKSDESSLVQPLVEVQSKFHELSDVVGMAAACAVSRLLSSS